MGIQYSFLLDITRQIINIRHNAEDKFYNQVTLTIERDKHSSDTKTETSINKSVVTVIVNICIERRGK